MATILVQVWKLSRMGTEKTVVWQLRLLVTPFKQYFQESRVEDWMEYKKPQALSAGFSFRTFEKEGILGKMYWLQ